MASGKPRGDKLTSWHTLLVSLALVSSWFVGSSRLLMQLELGLCGDDEREQQRECSS